MARLVRRDYRRELSMIIAGGLLSVSVIATIEWFESIVATQTYAGAARDIENVAF